MLFNSSPREVEEGGSQVPDKLGLSSGFHISLSSQVKSCLKRGEAKGKKDCCHDNASDSHRIYILSLPELQKVLGKEEMSQHALSWASNLESILNISFVKHPLQFIE